MMSITALPLVRPDLHPYFHIVVYALAILGALWLWLLLKPALTLIFWDDVRDTAASSRDSDTAP
jgi:hypothetical protein